jgi:hypothetical protein
MNQENYRIIFELNVKCEYTGCNSIRIAEDFIFFLNNSTLGLVVSFSLNGIFQWANFQFSLINASVQQHQCKKINVFNYLIKLKTIVFQCLYYLNIFFLTKL